MVGFGEAKPPRIIYFPPRSAASKRVGGRAMSKSLWWGLGLRGAAPLVLPTLTWPCLEGWRPSKPPAQGLQQNISAPSARIYGGLANLWYSTCVHKLHVDVAGAGIAPL